MAKRQCAALQRIYDAKGAQNVLFIVRDSTVHVVCMDAGNATTHAFPLAAVCDLSKLMGSLHDITSCKATMDVHNADVAHLLVHMQERFLYHYILTLRPILTLKLQSFRTLPRNALAICIAFTGPTMDKTKSNQVILIGEKTGKVMATPLEHAEGSDVQIKHLFGHTTSMITDITMDPSGGQFVLSADRNEKIRVSQFPQTALIQSYCLGHASAVVQVACCQRFQDENWMVSISKDGTVKLWDYLKSTMLDSKTLCDAENTRNGVYKLAMCPSTDCIAVIMGVHLVLLRIITSGKQPPTLEIFADSTSTSLSESLTIESEPLDAIFVPKASQTQSHLVIAYRQSPYLRCFELNDLSTTPSIASSTRFQAENWFSFVKEQQSTELTDDELTKKKLKSAH